MVFSLMRRPIPSCSVAEIEGGATFSVIAVGCLSMLNGAVIDDATYNEAPEKEARTEFGPGIPSSERVTEARPSASVKANRLCGPSRKVTGRPASGVPPEVSTALTSI